MSSSSFFKYAFFAALAVTIGVTSFWLYNRYKYNENIIEMSNALAKRDKTIEIKENVYTKLTLQLKGLENLLDSKDKQLSDLKKELKKRGEELLTTNIMVVKWKKSYEAIVKAKQTIIKKEDTKSVIVKKDDVKQEKIAKTSTDSKENSKDDGVRYKVEFEKDFGYIGVSGYTLTNPPIASLKVTQNRPLKLSVTVSQNKDKKWRTYVTSSEKDVNVDISLTAVNPYVLEKKWYEKLEFNTSLGLSTGANVLVGAGVGYNFGKFSTGPAVWFSVSDKVDRYFGLNFTWRPFHRN